MEFKGTKEKWQIDDNVIFADDYFQTHIAAVCAESYNNEITQANTLLISKAPEMLESLKELVSYLRAMHGAEDTECVEMLKAEKLIKQATEL